MADDWDLHAVVKGCATTTTTASSTTPTASSQNFQNQISGLAPIFPLPNPFEARNVVEDLDELFKPFSPRTQNTFPPQSSNISSFSSIFGSKEEAKLNQRNKKQSRLASISNSNPSKSKRRKNQMKRICQVPAEGLASDMWAWRKYGQKPIKGSPYPRGYYRCSSSKGCLARKMVERNRSDPNMFIVTYTAEHHHPAPNHRNSLAGSSRQKPITPQTAPAASASPATSVEEEVVKLEDGEEDDLGISNVVISDDFFEGLEGLIDGPVAGDCFSDQVQSNFGLPWIANNATTAASSI